MSNHWWPYAILEREKLALRREKQGLLGYGRWINIEPTVGNKVGPMSKMTSGQRHVQHRANKTANKMPTLAQRMIAICNVLLVSLWTCPIAHHFSTFIEEGSSFGGKNISLSTSNVSSADDRET